MSIVIRPLGILALLFISIHSYAQTPGNSLHFDGTDDYVSTSLPTVFNDPANNDFTIEAWIKPTSGLFERVVFAQLNSSNFVSVSLATTNAVYFYVNNAVGMKSTNNLPSGVWSHIACVWNSGTSTQEIYINGIPEILLSGGTSSLGTDNLMTIGSKTDGSQAYQGDIDELRIWDYKRTACEILDAMVSEYDVAQPNLVAYYQFNEGTAGATNTGVTTLSDFTANYNGTLQNFALTGSTSNWLASGAVITALNVPGGASGTDTQSACDSYLWIDGNTYTASNTTATHTIVGGAVNGCDSIVTLNLTITTVDITTSLTDPSIMANATGVSYQWLYCDSAYAQISGETGQTYIASANGIYAVEITNGSCVDTSACVTVVSVGLEDHLTREHLLIYPNPATSKVKIDLGGLQNVQLAIYNINGQLIMSERNISSGQVELELNAAPGVYVVEICTEDVTRSFKLIKH